MKCYTIEDVSEHSREGDMWIVINNKVYDVSLWSRVHPGGARIISHYAGEDATDAWTAVHSNKTLVTKYLATYHIGMLDSPLPIDAAMKDFRALRDKIECMGLFRADPIYYIAFLAHIFMFEFSAYLVLCHYGNHWLPWLLAVACFVVSQAQAGWLQHDFGHLGVFRERRLNHLVHGLLIGFYKGASAHWWNFRHQQHHVKPNIIRKDPDVSMPYMFLLGRVLPRVWGERRKGFMPYDLQHIYFFIFGPPLLLPIYFHFEVLYFVLKRRNWTELVLIAAFFTRFFYIFSPLLGVWGAFLFYIFSRVVESHWFVWCTQMNHVPMEIDRDDNSDWLRMQLAASCDVAPGCFTDWFTGRLNYQIEHHLFPTVPSHNYRHLRPLVKALCHKHGLSYVCRPSLWQAFAHLIRYGQLEQNTRSLKVSGEIWSEAYHSAT